MDANEQILNLGVLDQIQIPEVESLEDFEKNKVTKSEEKKGDESEITVDEEDFQVIDNEDLHNDSHLKDPKDGETNEEEGLKEIAKWGHDLGIFDFDETKFQANPDYFKEQFFEKVKAEALKMLPDEIKFIGEAYLKGIPVQDLVASKQREAAYNEIDESSLKDNEELMEEIIEADLSLQGFEPDEISEKIADYKEGLLFEKEAGRSLKRMKAYEAKLQVELEKQAKEKEENNRKTIETRLKEIKTQIDSTPSFIKGVDDMKPEDKNVLYDGITKRDREGKTALERKMSDPAVQMAVAQFVLNYGASLEKVAKKIETKVATKTKDTINNEPNGKKGTTPNFALMKRVLNRNRQQF